MMMLRVIQGHRLLQLGVGQSQLSQPKQSRPQRPVGLQEQYGVLQPLGQIEEFLSQRPRLWQLPPH
jgi:hypothetical protein